MKLLIHHYMTGSYDDDHYYYLVFDEDQSSWYVEYAWHFYYPSKANDTGTRPISFAELKEKEPAIYKKLLDLLRAKGFSDSSPAA